MTINTSCYTSSDTNASPESASFGAPHQFHAALDAYLHCDGNDYNTTRRLFEDTHWVRNLKKEMPTLAAHDMRKALTPEDFKSWMDEGRTYASASRLIRAKLAPLVNGSV